MFGVVHLLSKWDKERTVELANAFVQKGRHPALWNLVSRVIT